MLLWNPVLRKLEVRGKMAGNRTNDVTVHCSFCGKNQDEVKKIIAGNGVLFAMNVSNYHKKLSVKN